MWVVCTKARALGFKNTVYHVEGMDHMLDIVRLWGRHWILRTEMKSHRSHSIILHVSTSIMILFIRYLCLENIFVAFLNLFEKGEAQISSSSGQKREC